MKSRYSINQRPDGLEIFIPSPRRAAGILTGLSLLPVLFIMIDYLSASSQEGSLQNSPFTLLIIASSFIYTIGALQILAKELFGRETLVFQNDSMLVVSDILGFKRPQLHQLAETSNWRVQREPESKSRFSKYLPTLRAPGGLVFDYQGKSIRIASGLSQGEDETVLNLILEAYQGDFQKKPVLDFSATENAHTKLESSSIRWSGSELTVVSKNKTVAAMMPWYVLFGAAILFSGWEWIAQAPALGLLLGFILFGHFILSSGQRITISHQGIKISGTLGILTQKHYSVESIKNLELYVHTENLNNLTPTQRRLSPNLEPGEKFYSPDLKMPAFQFFYNGNRVLFGQSIEEAEARIILGTIEKYFPQYFK